MFFLCCAVLCFQQKGTVLQFVGMSCAVLCCAALCCAVLCCAVLCCVVLHCAVLCCAVLCCAVLCFQQKATVLQFVGMSCAVLCCAELCGAVQCCAVRCGAVQCIAVLHCATCSALLQVTHQGLKKPKPGMAVKHIQCVDEKQKEKTSQGKRMKVW